NLGIFFIKHPGYRNLPAHYSLSLCVENCKVSFGVFAMFSYVFAILLPAVQGQHFAPAPSPTSDGMTVDQGIACFLMLLALILTYLIHAFDAPLVV
ncbi:arabinogalactan protein 41-like, partial [Primulina eburnea]|uniref:arabinogalactan protein 41-like n=1 Tax=Primulina eburnea TaxID=1245227 RepID=UPI003C6C1FA3